MKLNQTNVVKLNNQFSAFANSAIKPKNCNFDFIIPKLQKYEKNYKRLGFTEIFLRNADLLADRMHLSGFTDFAGIIYSHLLKNKALSSNQKIYYIKKSLKIAEFQGDEVHILSRIVDLKRIYKQNNDSHNYLSMLVKEEFLLTKILAGYQDASSNHRTFSRGINTKHKYKFRLAACKVDIAKCLIKKEPAAAKSELIEALRIFNELDCPKESQFARLLLKQIESRL